MTSKELESIFASRSVRRGHALVLGERETLALIDAAQQNDVAIVGIEMHRTAEDGPRSTASGDTLGLAVDRSESWRQAREFVGYLTGKDVVFEVLLEAPHATQRARLRDGRDVVVEFGFWRPRFIGLFLPFVIVVVTMMVLFTLAGG